MPNQIETPPMPAGPSTAARPWGFWASVGWTLFAITAGLLAALAGAAAFTRWDTSLTITQLFMSRSPSPVLSLLLIVACAVVAAVLAFAAKRAGWSANAYLALVRPRGRYVLAGLLCVVVPLLIVFVHAQFDIRQIIAPEEFGRARGLNILHLQFFAVVATSVIAMPIMEEIVFRGFLYRGFSETRIGVVGAILITSVVWALIHINKSPAGIIDTAMHGVVWGWLRWYTGSLWVTIGAHVANNGIATLMTVAALYGWLG